MSHKQVIQNIVKIDTSGLSIEKYYPDNADAKISVVGNSEFSELVNKIKHSGKLPIAGNEIYFNSDTWDFTKSLTYASSGQQVIHFNLVPIEYKDIVKYYILQLIINGNFKLNTIIGKLQTLYAFLNYIVENKVPLSSIYPSIIDEYIKTQRSTNVESTVNKTIVVVKDFLISYSGFYKEIDMEQFEYSLLYEDNSRLMRAARIAGLTPDIPEQVFDDLIKGLLEIIKTRRGVNTKKSDRDKYIAISCLLLIVSQIGIRLGELLILKVNKVHEQTIKDKNGIEINQFVLTFESWKGTEFEGETITLTTPLNEISKYAYDVIVDLFSEQRKKSGSEFLFPAFRDKTKPINKGTFENTKKRLFILYRKELKSLNLPEDYATQLSTLTMASAKSQGFIPKDEIICDSDTISYPTITQFRVHVISELIKADFPIEYIKEMMGHLYAETTDGYNRIKPKQERPEEITAMYEDIVKNDIKIIGVYSKEYKEKINETIKSFNGKNVASSLKEIATILADEMPTRIKKLGACIKPDFSRDCMKDAEIDEFYCAYGVCQYIHHTFFMVDKTYQSYKLHVQSYEANLSKG